jgi:G3E family GTPase
MANERKRVRFVMVGGFLGAGKTTAIARLARHYVDAGRKVALVTNDQAYDLVDTHSLRSQGFDVGEVPGACFCCKFDDLVKTVEKLGVDQAPDIIIAEPVGSCTDLVATIIEPLRHLYADRFELGPLAVLLKPEHGRKILRQEAGGFSPKAAYIFLKQLEEADIVVVNKVDKLNADQRRELIDLVGQRYPEKLVLAISGRDGENFDKLVEKLECPAMEHRQFMEVDYDIYADGEAELGWLNCQLELSSDSESAFSLDETLLTLVARLRDALVDVDAEPAHLKVLAQSTTETAIANLVGSEVEPELSLASEINTSAAEFIVNARVAIDPDTLQIVVESCVAQLGKDLQLTVNVRGMQCFRPGRPVPTHRIQKEE